MASPRTPTHERRPFSPTQDPSSYGVALDHDIEIASRIGILMSCFALIEWMVPPLFARATGLSYERAAIILGHFSSLDTRLKLLRALVGTDEGANGELLSFIYRIEAARKLRNEYAHSIYTQTSEGYVITLWPSDAKRTPIGRLITKKIIEADTAQLRALTHDLTVASHPYTLPALPAAIGKSANTRQKSKSTEQRRKEP